MTRIAFLNYFSARRASDGRQHTLSLPKNMNPEIPKHTTFAVPHAFFDARNDRYTPNEMFFYVALRKLIDQLNPEGDWTLLFDAPGNATVGRHDCFASYGLSMRVCKSARRKLREDGLIETRYKHDRKGHRIGTEYRLVDDKLAHTPKAVYREIMGQWNGRSSVPLAPPWR